MQGSILSLTGVFVHIIVLVQDSYHFQISIAGDTVVFHCAIDMVCQHYVLFHYQVCAVITFTRSMLDYVLCVTSKCIAILLSGLQNVPLTHLPLVPHICISELG